MPFSPVAKWRLDSNPQTYHWLSNALPTMLPLLTRGLVSKSPTFYEQLLRQNPFVKKLQTQIVSA
jgi:hypothetical protein